MFILAIDTSNTTLSVAILEDTKVLDEITETTKNDHSKRLMPTIEKLFTNINRQVSDIDLIAVAEGPGSYTGIRIGVTVAKTLAWTLNKPLVGVSSLEILASNLEEDAYIIPLFDARRETVFAGVYEGLSKKVIIPDGHYEMRNLLNDLSNSDKIMYFLGNDVNHYWDMIVEVLGNKAVRVEDEKLNMPHASLLAKIALQQEPIDNVHHFIPKYHRLPEAEMNWIQEQKNKGL